MFIHARVQHVARNILCITLFPAYNDNNNHCACVWTIIVTVTIMIMIIAMVIVSALSFSARESFLRDISYIKCTIRHTLLFILVARGHTNFSLTREHDRPAEPNVRHFFHQTAPALINKIRPPAQTRGNDQPADRGMRKSTRTNRAERDATREV